MTEKKPTPVEAPRKLVRLGIAVHHEGPFVLSHLGLPDLLPEGTDYSPEQADQVRTLALKYNVPLIEKGN